MYIAKNVPLESKEVTTMFLAVPNALAKLSENENLPHPLTEYLDTYNNPLKTTLQHK